jgi:CheY-like chemotaxis protein
VIRHLNVLVVDDDPGILEVLHTFLDAKGYTVETRPNAVEALQALRARAFDLLISDIQMAGLDGFQLLEKTRADYPHVSIILMTAYEDEYPMAQAARAGADGYVAKPFTLKQFALVFEQAYWNALSRQDTRGQDSTT